jgi:hypothetical protein
VFGRTQCKICSSTLRSEVDAMLAAGSALREIATRFNFSVSGIHRHSQKCFVEGATESDTELRQLQDAARRQLARCERSGDRRGVTDSLKILAELRRRDRIASASSTRSPVQPPEGNQKNPSDLVSELRRIYGLNGPRWDEGIAHRPRTQAATQQWVEHLGKLVEETGDSEPQIAAAATVLASLLLNEPLERESRDEVRRLLEVGDEIEIVGVVEEGKNRGADGERIDNEPSDGGDERHIDSPDVDDHG